MLIAAVLGALLLLYGIYEWGRFAGGYNKFAQIQQRRELTAKVELLQRDNDELRGKLASAELARSVDDKAYSDVERNLAELQTQLLKNREELAFYRGIVSPEDGVDGLRIQRFEIHPAGAEGHYRLRLVLVQSMRQDAAVSGSVTMEIEGVLDGAPAKLTLADVGGEAGGDGKVPFRFRYFQDLEQGIMLSNGFEPRTVNVEVSSARLAPMRESFPWQVQAEN